MCPRNTPHLPNLPPPNYRDRYLQGQVLADSELARVDHRRQARRARDVGHEMACSPHEVGTALVDRGLEHRRVRPREVRRRQRVDDVARRKPRLPLGAPVDPRVGDQPVDALGERQVRLHHAAERPAGLPRGVGKAPVSLRGSAVGSPRRHADEVRPQAADPARRAPGMPRQPGRHARGGERPHESRPLPDRGVREQHVESGAPGRVRHDDAPRRTSPRRVSRSRA